MESDIFRAGTMPGAPGTVDEIKMLLCYILSGIGEAMSFDQLYDAMSEHHLVNYFELVRVMDELVELGHIDHQDGRYAVTGIGREAAREFERTLPASVREKALDSSRKALTRSRRLEEISFTRTPCDGGYTLEITIPESEGELMSFRLFCPTKEDCDLIRRRFLNAPFTIYKGVMALLTGNKEVLGEIFGGEEKLF